MNPDLWEFAPTRCPICEAGLGCVRSRRLAPAGGRWHQLGQEHFTVRCQNGHTGDGESLHAAIDQIIRNR